MMPLLLGGLVEICLPLFSGTEGSLFGDMFEHVKIFHKQ